MLYVYVRLLSCELNVKMVHFSDWHPWVLLFRVLLEWEVLGNRILCLNSRLAALLFSDFIFKLNVLFFLL
jgi:hypothetical protein